MHIFRYAKCVGIEIYLAIEPSRISRFCHFGFSQLGRYDILSPCELYAALREGERERDSPLSRNEHNWHRQDDLTCVLIIP